MHFNCDLYAAQLKDFDGLGKGSRRPSDIDIAYDTPGVLVVGEFKFGGARFPTGQRITMERMVRGAAADGRHGVAFIADHHDRAEDGPIKAAGAVVRLIYTDRARAWIPPKKPTTVKNLIDAVEGGEYGSVSRHH